MMNAVADFSIPDTVCLGTPVTITNNSVNASNYFWNFCVADIRQTPVGTNLGNGGGNFNMPVFMDYVYENGNYYGFVTNFYTPGLTRLDFGNSLLNTPTYHYLGTLGVIPSAVEGIQVVKNEGKWYAIMVGGNTVFGTPSSVLKLDFGADITNPTPVGTNWGNIGGLYQPLDLHLFKDGENWFGFTLSADASTITRFNFTNSFDNVPTGTNFGNVGGLAYPTGIHVVNNNGQWHAFVTNGGNDSRASGQWSLTRLDFGNSLLNTPTGINLGNPGNRLKHPRDLTIMVSCGQIVGYAVNGAIGTDDIVMFDFNGDLLSVPVFTSLGNQGQLNFPHSITKLFRDGSDLYAFVTNVQNNTLTRLRFQGCSETDFPPSTLQTPPPVVYTSAGTYGINLTIDVGLATQDMVCKPVVVLPPLTQRPTPTINLCQGQSLRLGTQTKLGTHVWSTGQTGDSIEVSQSGIYWVETNYYGCLVRDSFEIQITPVPQGFLGPDQMICGSTPMILDASSVSATQYEWNTGETTPSIQVSAAGEYIVTALLANGCEAFDTVVVDLAGTAFDFTYRQDVCDPLTVQFSHSGISGSDNWWDFGDGTTLTNASSAVRQFAAEGNYTVRYVVANSSCSDTISKTITVAVIPADIIITPDTTICAGTTKLLRTLPALSFCWTPQDFLDDPLKANPVTSTPNAIRYYFTAERIGENAIVNGDFSQGNVGFASGYVFSPGSGLAEGTYSVTNNVPAWHSGMAPCPDHTGSAGNGNMMVVNGSAAPNMVVWSQTITITPNTNYAFSAWIQSLVASNPAQLQFSINGIPVGTTIVAASNTCSWSEFYTTWNSGSLTSATIAIVNRNTGLSGNDFALDDISFAPVFIQRDSVEITVDNPMVTAQPVSTVCTDEPVQLNADGAINYVWDNAAYLNNSTLQNPTAIVRDTTRFIVTGVNQNGCEAKDTVWVNVFPRPDIQVSNDTSICVNASVQLWISGGETYEWSPVGTLDNPNSASPVANPLEPTKYLVQIYDQHNCTFHDSVFVDLRPVPVFWVSNASSVCYGDSVQLQASGGDTYSWLPVDGLNNSGVPNPMVAPANTTEYEVTISENICGYSETLRTTVTVNPTPQVTASRSNDLDCSIGSSNLQATGAFTYSWSPVESLSDPLSANPIARPRVTTTYKVIGTSQEGCPAEATVEVKVLAVNEGMYLMPNAFTPNGDGLNDCFGVKYWGVVEQIEFSIFNRWGERIFYSKDPNACWDGMYKGVKQDSGVFIYMIRAKTACADEVFRKGTITLIR